MNANALCAELQRIWHAQIPISAAMDIAVVEFANDVLVVRAELAPNVNVHGTAFAGSLYAIAALCGWGMTWLQLKVRDMDASIVIAQADIRYTAPVQQAIVATCRFQGAALDAAMARLASTGKARFNLACSIDAHVPDAALFSGEYAVRRNSGDTSHG
jgi:thioesterase domain-containing protein